MLEIPIDERKVTDEQVFSAFDLNYKGMEIVKAAWEQGDISQAKQELVTYFHNRKNVQFLFDYRGLPLQKINPNESPYSFQSSLGLSGNLQEFCLYVGKKMMQNIYVLPGGNRGEVDLGKNFEHMIHFNFVTDQGKRHRHHLDMFVRGQFFESLGILYHETGDPAVANKFAEVINKFFETYPLQIVNGGPKTSRFQYDEDRDVMSVGWLTIVLLSLFYTELPYAVKPDLAFEILKRIWFLGIQFRRFDTDSYRAYNHHMWERGLVPFILSTLLPEIPDFASMKEKGAAVVCRHVKEDFNDHGGYSEHSIAYWSGAAVGEMLYRGVYIAQLNNETLLDEEAQQRITATFNALACISAPGTRYPSLGDNAGPMIDPILQLGVRMADNTYCKSLISVRSGKQAPEQAVLPLDYCDTATGFACARSNFSSKATYFLMSVKQNCGYSGHNHMDMLSMCITVRGEAILGEPYAGQLYHTIRMGSNARGFMYNMTAHNTVLAYGEPVAPNTVYANKWGVYLPDTPVTAYTTNEQGMYLCAHHDAYTFCRHRRKVLFSRKAGLLVRDEVERGNRMDKPHIQRWYLEYGTALTQLAEDALLIEKNGVRMLCLWNGAKNISIWHKDDLCPEIIAAPEQLADIIDVRFAAPKEKLSDNITVPIAMLMLDVTDKTIPDFALLHTGLEELGQNMEQENALSFFEKLIG